MDDKADHVVVFTTSKSMHERFSAPKQQRSVFVLDDDDAVPGKKESDNGTLLDKEMETNEMHSSFNKCNIGKNKQITKNQRPPFVRRRRKPLRANTLENGTECAGDKTIPVHFRSTRFNSNTPKPGLRYGKYNTIGKRFTGRNGRGKRTNNISLSNLSGKSYYNWSFPRKWRRNWVSKDQLDDEIDKYMAEVNQMPSLTEDEYEVERNEQLLEETEQFLKKYEEDE